MTTLHTATTKEEIAQLLSNGANVDEKDRCGKKPFFLACEQGNLEVVMALHEACQQRETTTWYDGCVFYHPRINHFFHTNLSPIDVAAKKGHYYVVEFLISRKYDYKNVLMFAAMNGSMDIIDMLFQLETLLDINKPFEENSASTPLNIACLYGQYDVVNILLNRGAIVDKYSLCAAGVACKKFTLCEDLSMQQPKQVSDEIICSILKALVSQGADVKAATQKIIAPGNTIMHILAETKKLESINFLIGVGGDINAKDAFEYTPLMHVCGRPNVDIDVIQNLLDNGADINMSGENGDSPLYIACCKSNPDIILIKLLITRGADINTRDNYGRSILHRLCGDVTNKLKIFRLLIESGIDINARDKYGNTAIITLYDKNENFPIEIFRLMINNGADINLCNFRQRSPLLSLCYFKNLNIEAFKLLIENGANVNTQSKNGNTPLIILCKFRGKNFQEVVQLLIDNGALINIANKRGFIPHLP